MNINDIWENYYDFSCLEKKTNKFFDQQNLNCVFEIKTPSTTKLLYLEPFHRKFVVKFEKYLKNNKCEKNIINCNNSYVIDNLYNCVYMLGKVDKIDLLNGFPIFGNFPITYLNSVFIKTLCFLNGDINCFDFCNHFGLIYFNKSVLYTDLLDSVTMINLNKMNLQNTFYNIINQICTDYNVNNTILLFHSNQIQFETRNFEIQIHIASVNNTLELSCIFNIPICNEVDDYPFVITSAAFILYIICHYINNNKTYIYEIVPRDIILSIGKSFYFRGYESLISNYKFIPIILNNFRKPISEYIFQDFIF